MYKIAHFPSYFILTFSESVIYRIYVTWLHHVLKHCRAVFHSVNSYIVWSDHAQTYTLKKLFLFLVFLGMLISFFFFHLSFLFFSLRLSSLIFPLLCS